MTDKPPTLALNLRLRTCAELYACYTERHLVAILLEAAEALEAPARVAAARVEPDGSPRPGSAKREPAPFAVGDRVLVPAEVVEIFAFDCSARVRYLAAGIERLTVILATSDLQEPAESVDDFPQREAAALMAQELARANGYKQGLEGALRGVSRVIEEFGHTFDPNDTICDRVRDALLQERRIAARP